jgi:hypothetical protein
VRIIVLEDRSIEGILDYQAMYVRHVFSLASVQDGSQARFHNLTRDTQIAMAGLLVGAPRESVIYDHRCGNIERPSYDFLRWQGPVLEFFPAELVQRWRHWQRDFPLFMARHPKIELLELIWDIGDSSLESPWWPSGMEAGLRDWADGGRYEPKPFQDHGAMPITRAHFERLQTLRKALSGWIWWADPYSFPEFRADP